jgi:hypothetical protein
MQNAALSKSNSEQIKQISLVIIRLEIDDIDINLLNNDDDEQSKSHSQQQTVLPTDSISGSDDDNDYDDVLTSEFNFYCNFKY